MFTICRKLFSWEVISLSMMIQSFEVNIVTYVTIFIEYLVYDIFDAAVHISYIMPYPNLQALRLSNSLFMTHLVDSIYNI